MTVFVLREPTPERPPDWFTIGKPIFEYGKDDLVPCTFYNDTQNMEPYYVKYISRFELLTGPYRFYWNAQTMSENVHFEFQTDL